MAENDWEMLQISHKFFNGCLHRFHRLNGSLSFQVYMAILFAVIMAVSSIHRLFSSLYGVLWQLIVAPVSECSHFEALKKPQRRAASRARIWPDAFGVF